MNVQEKDEMTIFLKEINDTPLIFLLEMLVGCVKEYVEKGLLDEKELNYTSLISSLHIIMYKIILLDKKSINSIAKEEVSNTTGAIIDKMVEEMDWIISFMQTYRNKDNN